MDQSCHSQVLWERLLGIWAAQKERIIKIRTAYTSTKKSILSSRVSWDMKELMMAKKQGRTSVNVFVSCQKKTQTQPQN